MNRRGRLVIFVALASVLLMLLPCIAVRTANSNSPAPVPHYSQYTILAAYWPYGKGIVEGFAYHPQEQTGSSYTLASIFYGNKFVHSSHQRSGNSSQPTAITFPVDSYVIPFDSKQADILLAFGFVHSLLTNTVVIDRIIEPPDVSLYTNAYPGGSVYDGGPIVVSPSYSATFLSTHNSFQTVTYHQLTSAFASNTVFTVKDPTEIMVIEGIWGHTEQLLQAMQIPYTLTQVSNIQSNPNLIDPFDVVVDDCPGWDCYYGGTMPVAVQNAFRAFAAGGGEIIFTDRALGDMDVVFPNYANVVGNIDGTWTCRMHDDIPEFPAQYSGPLSVDIYTMGGGCVIEKPIDQNVRVLVDYTPAGSPPTITLTAPNGGEVWDVGSQKSITWTASGGTAPLSIELEYSVTGAGGPYALIANNLPNTGSYLWTIPPAPSTTACVRATVTDNNGYSASDTSNADFTINVATPSLYVSVVPSPITVLSGGMSSIFVHVVDDSQSPVNGASVSLSSNNGGTFNPQNGLTNSYGDFGSSFMAPTVSSQTTCIITASVTLTGYNPGSAGAEVIVNPTGQQSLYVVLYPDPYVLNSGWTSLVKVIVTNGSAAVNGAAVSISASKGSLSPTSGPTDVNGTFLATYTAPTVVVKTMCRLNATATKSGLNNGKGYADVTVLPLTPGALDHITLTPASAFLQVGQKLNFTAQAYDVNGIPINYLTYGWVTNGGVGTVFPPTGDKTQFNATSPGSGTVEATATYQSVTKTGTALVTVTTTSGLLIAITSPADGSTIQEGKSFDIIWASSGGTPPLSVRLDYSTTSPSGPYSAIAAGLPGSGTFTWTVWSYSGDMWLKANVTDSASNGAEDIVHVTVKIVKEEWNRTFASPGWYLVSIPLNVSGDVPTILASIAGNYSEVQAFNATDADDGWKTYNVTRPSYVNDLENLDCRMGFWLLITGTCTLSMKERGSQTTTIHLTTGWNLVGFPSNKTNTKVLDVKASVQYCDEVQGFDISKQYRLRQLLDTEVLSNGYGYWLHVTQDCDWVVQW